MFLTLRNRPSLYPNGTGIDKMFDEIFSRSFSDTSISKYPATDVYVEDDVTYIEVAVTGFSKDDITIAIDNGTLCIEAATAKEHNDREYYSRGIAKRSFKREYVLNDTVEDIKATVEDGLLTIRLIEKEPEDTRRLIEIT